MFDRLWYFIKRFERLPPAPQNIGNQWIGGNERSDFTCRDVVKSDLLFCIVCFLYIILASKNILIYLQPKHKRVCGFIFSGEKIVRSVVLYSCHWKPEKLSRKHKNGIVCFLRWFPAWDCYPSILCFRVFSGPSMTNGGTQFYAFCFIIRILKELEDLMIVLWKTSLFI